MTARSRSSLLAHTSQAHNCKYAVHGSFVNNDLPDKVVFAPSVKRQHEAATSARGNGRQLSTVTIRVEYGSGRRKVSGTRTAREHVSAPPLVVRLFNAQRHRLLWNTPGPCLVLPHKESLMRQCRYRIVTTVMTKYIESALKNVFAAL